MQIIDVSGTYGLVLIRLPVPCVSAVLRMCCCLINSFYEFYFRWLWISKVNRSVVRCICRHLLLKVVSLSTLPLCAGGYACVMFIFGA
jgi:hypothetical protein